MESDHEVLISEKRDGKVVYVVNGHKSKMGVSWLSMAFTWLCGHRGLILGLGCGVLIGMSGTIIVQNTYSRLDMRLAQLCMQLDNLRFEIDSLKSQLSPAHGDHRHGNAVPQQRKVRMGYYSVHASSGEDDDDFQDARSSSDLEQQLVGRDVDLKRIAPAASDGAVNYGEPESVFETVDDLLDGTDAEKEDAVRILMEGQTQLSDNSDFQWRTAKATYFLSQIEGMRGNEDRKKTLVYQAFDFAKRALSLDDSNPFVHKWYAITIGSIGDYESNAERIKNGYAFKEHIDMAIKLKPEDPAAHYLKGRWCYGVYQLTWVERKLAATLFSEPPSATVDEALEEFMEADRLDPGKWKENLLYIGKCYVEKKDYYTAMDYFTKANRLPTVSADEKEAQKELDTLMYKYSGYVRQ